jgi:hypothetical protein
MKQYRKRVEGRAKGGLKGGEGTGEGTKVVHPFTSFVSIPFGDRIEMTLFLKCHSKAK